MPLARVARLALVASVVTSAWGSGCSIEDVDLEGRPCPCATGWVCVAGTCERCEGASCDPDASLADASVDAPSADARASLDAWALDAPGLDAPGLDAWALDAPSVLDDAFVPATDDAFVPGADAFEPPPDAFVLASVCDLPIAGRLWCTGFENAYDDFTYVVPDSTFVTSPVRRGMHAGRSLPCSGGAGCESVFERDIAFPSEPGAHIHLTGWVRRESAETGPDMTLFNLLDAGLVGRLVLGMMSDGRVLVLAGAGVGVYGDAVLAAGQWTCLRLDAELGPSGTVRIFVMHEGEAEREVMPSYWDPAPDLVSPPGGFDSLRIGVNVTSAPPSHAFVFDEVAVGTAPQPCVP
ncbi:MAG: hypothetical protein K1X94_13625 [Sandaracinaceae bacterium]|nr:hypothetical protein [Sandaracinaceae bacterium]